MNYRELGKTGKQVSVLGFGLMRLPVIDGDHSRIDEERSLEMVNFAIENGVNYFDTAYPYHSGRSEIFAGRILKQGYRDKVYIADKLPSWLIKETSDFDKYLTEQLEKLGTEQIDFYLLHALNSKNWENLKDKGVLEWLEAKKKSGIISHVGFSFHDNLSVFRDIIGEYNWEFCQIQYNYLDIEFQAGQAGLDLAAERGIGVVVMEPLRGGLLAKKPPAEVQSIIKVSDYSGTLAGLSLRWVWQQPEVGLLLSGMNSMEQVRENISLASGDNFILSESENELVTRLREGYHSRIKVPCTGCNYCQPCPQGVAIPGVFHFYNTANIFDDQNWGRRFYGFIKEENQADKCVECGICEEKCPQQIAIMENLKTAHKYLKSEK